MRRKHSYVLCCCCCCCWYFVASCGVVIYYIRILAKYGYIYMQWRVQGSKGVHEPFKFRHSFSLPRNAYTWRHVFVKKIPLKEILFPDYAYVCVDGILANRTDLVYKK